MVQMENKKKKPLFKRWWFWAIVVIIAVGALGSNGDKDKTPTKETSKVEESNQTEDNKGEVKKTELEKVLEEAIEVDYKKLHSDYMDNAIKADGEYKNKMLILTGEISDIDREIAGNPYVIFDVDGVLNNVRITFKKSEEEKVAEFEKGQTIKIVGKCGGTLLSTTVALSDCLLVE